ncbi:MAG TPA: hypothetical protein DCZ95_01870 [Verrucomicrobia bacterium]|nr:hypothetical protein [Verrucomicrobiota bacterium]
MTPFLLERYLIDSIAVISNEQFDPSKKTHTGDTQVNLSVARHKNDTFRYRLVLEAQMRPTKGKESNFFPYHIGVKGRGYFLFKELVPYKTAEHILRLNGAAILYGLLRGQIAQITAQSAHGQFLLPPANFVEAEKHSGSESIVTRAKNSKELSSRKTAPKKK